MYKPLQIEAPQTRNAKNPPLIRPSIDSVRILRTDLKDKAFEKLCDSLV